MRFKVIISDEAKLDIKESKKYYAEIDADLAKKFVAIIIKTVDNLSESPLLYQERYKEIRIVFTKTFPFGIHYFIEGNTITVLKVFHTKRSY